MFVGFLVLSGETGTTLGAERATEGEWFKGDRASETAGWILVGSRRWVFGSPLVLPRMVGVCILVSEELAGVEEGIAMAMGFMGLADSIARRGDGGCG